MEFSRRMISAKDIVNNVITGIRYLPCPEIHLNEELRFFFELSDKLWIEMIEHSPWATEFKTPIVDETTIQESFEAVDLRDLVGKKIIDVLGTSCWSHFGLLVEGDVVLKQNVNLGYSKIYSLPLERELDCDDLKSWVTGRLLSQDRKC